MDPVQILSQKSRGVCYTQPGSKIPERHEEEITYMKVIKEI